MNRVARHDKRQLSDLRLNLRIEEVHTLLKPKMTSGSYVGDFSLLNFLQSLPTNFSTTSPITYFFLLDSKILIAENEEFY